MTKHSVSTPLLTQLNGGALKISVILFQLAFKPGQKRKRVSGGSGEACQYTIVVETADLLRVCFHDGFAQRDLAVTGQRNLIFFTDEQHSSAANAWSFSGHFW